jgi:DNA polymerase
VKEVVLRTPGDFAEWRSAARALLAGGVAPEDVSWRGGGDGASLFGGDDAAMPAGTVSLPR